MINIQKQYLLSAVAAVALAGAVIVSVSSQVQAQSQPPQPTVISGSDNSPVPRPPEAAGAPAPAPAPDAAVVPAIPQPGQVVSSPPMPDATALKQPEPAPTSVTPMPDSVTGGASVAKIPKGEGDDRPDVYYDSSLNVPTGPLSETVGPRKVDPVQEPASKLVIARKNNNASDQESQLVAANRALELGRYESALELFQQLSSKNTRDPRILMGLAVAQQKTGLDDQAILTYESLLKIVPNNIDAVINMSGLLQKQYPEIALRKLLDLDEKHPGNPGIAAQLGMVYAQAGDSAQAMVALGKAAALQPENASHMYNMAIVADRTGKKQQAINYYERALEVDAVYGNGRSIPRETVYDRLAKLRRN